MSAFWNGAEAEQSAIAPQAQGSFLGRFNGADLEQAFWICDYTATTLGVDATPVDLCSAVTDEFKNVRFGGDFGEMLEWWRQNKLTEHRKLEAAGEDIDRENVARF